MFLSGEQLIEVTGKKQPAAQRRALRLMRIPHRVRPDGKPLVAEADLLHSKPHKAETPDWDAL